MKKILLTILVIIFSLSAQALFEIKDASDNTVFSISDDGLRVFNLGDTLMVISASEIKANIGSSKDKALSRSFSVTTSTTGKAGLANVLEVTTESTTMREGIDGYQYTNFSPENIFVGLNAGINTTPNSPSANDGTSNVFMGNNAGNQNVSGRGNVFIGEGSGQSSDIWHFNTFVGTNAGYNSNMSDNTFVGYAAGYSNVDGACNAILGDFASAFNVSGDHNSIFGHGAGINLIAGNDNTFMGYWAGMGTSGSNSYYNCFFGSEAGKDVSGNSNVMLGRQSGLLNQTGSGNVFVGNQAGYQETGSNKLYISNSTTATPLIYGDFLFNNRYLRINGENLWINNIEASTTNLTIDGNDGYIKQLRFYEAGAYKAGFGWSGSSDYIFLYEGGTNSFSSKGGLIGIRTVSPQAYLHVGLAGEVNATEGGGFILGPTASYNLSMDENEIQARNGTGVASLYLNNYGGNVYAGGTFLGSSDLRLKKDIADVSYGLKDVLKMRSVSFNWKNTKNQHKSMGFIAQELESIFPELVFDDEKGMKSVNYDGIIPILVNSIKEQQNRIEELENDIEEIKKLLIK